MAARKAGEDDFRRILKGSVQCSMDSHQDEKHSDPFGFPTFGGTVDQEKDVYIEMSIYFVSLVMTSFCNSLF